MRNSGLRWTGTLTALIGLLAASSQSGHAAGLTLIRPHEGDTVREVVRVEIPHSSIPPGGFASLFIDGLFHLAQAPALNSSKALTFRWDTKAILQDTSLKENQRVVEDGEHVIEVRTFTADGRMAERAAVHVRVANRLPIKRGEPIFLGYKFHVGDSTKYDYTYDLKASAVQNSAGSQSGLPEINYREFDKVVASVEDVDQGKSFMRERRLSPVTISFGDVGQAVPVDESSRYYTMDPGGNTVLSTAMSREKRFPMYNAIGLPNRSIRVGQSWRSIVKIYNGAFATGRLGIPATNTLEAIEWEHGVPTARIKSVYHGTAKLTLPYAGIQDGLVDVKGTSIFYYAPSSGKIVRSVHDLEGTLKIDTNAATQSTGGPASYGGPGAYPGPTGGAGGYPAPGPNPSKGGYPGAPGGPPGGYPTPGGGPGGGYPTPGAAYDPSQNQGGPIPGVPIYQNYSLKIHAIAQVV